MMESVLKEALETLGFMDVTEVPRMKDIRKKWMKLSLLLHPDKSTGSKEAFQKLVAAYKTACEAADELKFDSNDLEEEIVRKMFQQFQLSSVIENLQCYTI